MAPLSILPGRVRFEFCSLIGKPRCCCRLEQRIGAWEEIRDVRVNPRTGRMLIRFDENRLCRSELLHKIQDELQQKSAPLAAAHPAETSALQKKIKPVPIGQCLLKDILTHALLPAPLDLILPAVSLLRKNPAQS